MTPNETPRAKLRQEAERNARLTQGWRSWAVAMATFEGAIRELDRVKREGRASVGGAFAAYQRELEYYGTGAGVEERRMVDRNHNNALRLAAHKASQAIAARRGVLAAVDWLEAASAIAEDPEQGPRAEASRRLCLEVWTEEALRAAGATLEADDPVEEVAATKAMARAAVRPRASAIPTTAAVVLGPSRGRGTARAE